MTKELLISSSPHETKIAVLEDDQLVEVYFQRDSESGLVGGIYKGRVNRVLPGMQSAFVDIGLERDAFLYVSDFFEESEEYDRVFTEAENRVVQMSEGDRGQPSVAIAEAGEAATVLESAQPASGPVTPAPADVPQETTGTPTAERIEPPAPARDDFRQREFPRREFPGRRHRRRGRGFREGRFGFRREAGGKAADSRKESQPQSLEPLPGESLAKYSHPATEPAHPQEIAAGDTEGAPRPVVENEAQQQNTGFVAEPAAHEPINPYSAPVETHPPVPEPTSADEGEHKLSPHPDVTPALADEALTAASQVEEAEPPVVEGESTASEETLATRAGSDVSGEAGGEEMPSDMREGDAAAVPPHSSSPPIDEAGLPGSLGDQETAAAEGAVPLSESAATEPEAYPTYTVRESHQRPHLAPRRGRRGGRGRFRGHFGSRTEPESSRAGNHQPTPISELLKEGQEILVQIAKEPLGTKGARITSHIALPGRYLVYMPTITHIGVSRKIGSEEERLRLRNIILDNRGSLTGGFIVRTAGAGRSEEEIKADLAFLTNLWNEIRGRAERSKAPALLHRDLTLVERILRDLLSPEFKCIRTDIEVEYEHVLEFVNRFQPALVGHVKLYTRETPLFEEFGVQAEIDKALKPKVWLKSGGYIVINQTEALVAIDVNTGKFVGKTNRLEDTIVKTNIDAVMEIVRQIRLRDLGGIIVIDFIDMDERRNRAKVVQALDEALRRDRAPTKILAFNEFGLVALTRKRAKQSLERTLCEPCPYCAAAGWVKSVATVSNEIVAEARKMATQIDGRVMTLRVNPQVAATLKSKGGALISEMEAASGKEVVIKSDSSIPQERFEIF